MASVAQPQSSEHILLESDEREVPELRTARKRHSQLWLRSRLRRRAVELTLIDFYYLSVRAWRARRSASSYVLDLRFVDARVRLRRHVAWRWIGTSAVLFAAAFGVAYWIGSSSTVWWRHEWLAACGALFALAAGATLVSMYRTTETLTYCSLNGQVPLLEYTGGLGTFRAIRRFHVQLSAHLRLAGRARRTSRASHLRDEMREHFRLKEAGALSEQDYELSKQRILSGHTTPRARVRPVGASATA